jgi:hypothetical protein
MMVESVMSKAIADHTIAIPKLIRLTSAIPETGRDQRTDR